MKKTTLLKAINEVVKGREVIKQTLIENSYELKLHTIVESTEAGKYDYLTATISTRETNDNVYVSEQAFDKLRIVQYLVNFEKVEKDALSKHLKEFYTERSIKKGLADKILTKALKFYDTDDLDAFTYELTGVEVVY